MGRTSSPSGGGSESANEGFPNPRMPSTPRAPSGALSVREAFAGACVLLTGVTGYVGSLVLEQMLRVCPDVETVFVLVRAKKSLTANERIARLLNSALFRLLWDKPEVLSKVRVVEGDVTAEGMGLSPSDTIAVLQNTNFVIHSAAAVALDDHIHKTLKNNYEATRNLLEMCKQMPKLRCYCHVSTAFVNISFPYGSTVKEEVYSLMNGDQAATHEEIALDLLDLPPDEANEKAEMMMKRWDMPNTYVFGKRLAEQLVMSYHSKSLPVCIVRPSLIAGLAGDPYPGYIGNMAGGGGYAIAFAIGFFENNSFAWKATSVMDGIPGDTVSSVVLAAAASTATCPLKEGEPVVFHACTSTTYPLANYELAKAAKTFFTKEPPPYCLQWSYPKLDPCYEPVGWKVWIAKSITWLKVNSLCCVLRWVGKDRLANRLYTGWRAWTFATQSRYDMNLYFSTENVKALDAMLVDRERKDIRCLWTPWTGNWSRFMKIAMAGIKQLLLKSPLLDSSDNDFVYYPPNDPPFAFPLPPGTSPKPTSPDSDTQESPLTATTTAAATTASGRVLRTVSDCHGQSQLKHRRSMTAHVGQPLLPPSSAGKSQVWRSESGGLSARSMSALAATLGGTAAADDENVSSESEAGEEGGLDVSGVKPTHSDGMTSLLTTK